jgi:OOP family OmpA-OmpF porin
MMRFFRLAPVAAALAFVATTASANPYLSGSFGATSVNSPAFRGGTSFELDDGNALNLAVGYVVPGYRMELEFGRRASDITGLRAGEVSVGASGEVEVLSLMGNLVFDFYLAERLTAYLGVGAGYAQVKVKGFAASGFSAVNDKDTVFAYQGTAGISYLLGESISLFVQYRHFTARGAKLVDSFDVEFEMGRTNVKSVEGGVRIAFP